VKDIGTSQMCREHSDVRQTRGRLRSQGGYDGSAGVAKRHKTGVPGDYDGGATGSFNAAAFNTQRIHGSNHW